jgi:hypothetical protein
VAADRTSVETVAKKCLFSRSARTALKASPDLAAQVEALLLKRLLDGLGLARRAGDLVTGFEKVVSTVGEGRAAWLVEATDGAPDGRRKVLSALRRASPSPGLVGLWTGDEVSLAVGGETVIHTAFLVGRGADRWTFDVQRLSGFRPLVPESWSEAPASAPRSSDPAQDV